MRNERIGEISAAQELISHLPSRNQALAWMSAATLAAGGGVELGFNTPVAQADMICTTTEQGGGAITICTSDTTPPPVTVISPAPTPEQTAPEPTPAAEPTTVAPITPVTETAPTATTPATKKKTHKQIKHATTIYRPHFVDYNQNAHTAHGYQWGSRIASSGCGPSSMAMVAATLTGDRHITPATVASDLSPRYYVPGSGTLASGFSFEARKYGIAESKLNMHRFASQVGRVLQEGGLVIVHARPGHFTGAGHYMVVKDEKISGNRKLTFRLADPNSKPGRDSEKRLWTPNQLRAAGIDAAYGFTN